MSNTILITIGSASVVLWGIAHLLQLHPLTIEPRFEK